MQWEYYVLEWGIPWESEQDEREYAFCRDGRAVEEFAGKDRRELEPVLNTLGAQGWELVETHDWRKFFLKRPRA